MGWHDAMRRGRRRGADAGEIERELREHLALEAEAQEEDGMTPDSARRSARLLFGNPALIREDVRAVSRWAWWERLRQDTRYALRTFRRSPVFTATAVLSLALGIGANTAMFTLVDAALLRQLPVNRPDDLALISTPDNFSYPTYRALSRDSRSLTALVAAASSNRMGVDLGGETRQAAVKAVSGSYFEGLGVVPAAGRLFRSTEETDAVAVVSHDFWRTQFGASSDTVGRSIRVSGAPFTVVGVAPAGFFGEAPGESPDIWTTLALQPAQRRNGAGFTWLRLIGRLGPGVTLAQAEAEIKALTPELPIAVSAGGRGSSGLRQRFAAPLAVMCGMVGLVLLIACTNLASLLLTRGAARGPEIAVRLALGAGRGRVVGQLMTENLLMAAVGGGLGLLLSLWGTRLLLGLVAAAGQTLTLNVRLDARVLLFAAVMSVATSLLFGLAPALRTAGAGAAASLVNQSRAVVGRPRRWALGDALIVIQIALSLVLIACGGLFVRTVSNLRTQDLGVRVEHLVVANINAERDYRPSLPAVLPDLIERVRALPGVESASVAAFGTLASQGGVYGLEVDGYTPRTEQDQRAQTDYVGPDYLRTAGIPLVSGREFTWADQAASRRVAIVNQTMARFYFGDGIATGRRFRFNKQEYEIVGVAADARYNSLRQTTTPRFIYFAALQSGAVRNLEIRTSSAAAPTAAVLRGVMRAVDPRSSIGDVTPMTEQIGRKIGQESMVATLTAFFGGLTLLLASIGIYGTIAYSMERRTREIGLRLALGSRRHEVVWLVVRHVIALVTAGILVGIAALLAAGPVLRSLLFGVQPGDPLTIAIATGLLATVALTAASIPSIRTSRLDPALVLRD